MLDVRYSHLYFYQSLNRLQHGLSAIAELLVPNVIIGVHRNAFGSAQIRWWSLSAPQRHGLLISQFDYSCCVWWSVNWYILAIKCEVENELFSSTGTFWGMEGVWKIVGLLFICMLWKMLQVVIVLRGGSPLCSPTPSAATTPHWSSQASSETVSFTFTYHTWQFIIFFTIFTITTCIFSYSFSLSLWTKDLALWQIISSIDPFPFLPDWFHGLSDHLMFLSAQRLDLFAWCVRLSWLWVGFWTHFKSSHFQSVHFISFHSLWWTIPDWTDQLHWQYTSRCDTDRHYNAGCLFSITWMFLRIQELQKQILLLQWLTWVWWVGPIIDCRAYCIVSHY